VTALNVPKAAQEAATARYGSFDMQKNRLIILFICFLFCTTAICQNFRFIYSDSNGKFKNKSDFLNLFKDSSQIITNDFTIADANKKIIYQYRATFGRKVRVVKNSENSFSFFESYFFNVDGILGRKEIVKSSDETFFIKEVIKYDLFFVDTLVLLKLDEQFSKNAITIKYDTNKLVNDFNKYKKEFNGPISDEQGTLIMQLLTGLTISALQGCELCADLVENFDKSFEMYGAFYETWYYNNSIIKKAIRGKVN
jgi:hypothetical protein